MNLKGRGTEDHEDSKGSEEGTKILNRQGPEASTFLRGRVESSLHH